MKGSHGYTVLEALVALCIAAIGLAVAVPSMMEYSREQRMNAWMMGLHGMLHHAREQAVLRRQRVVVCASLSGEWCDAGVEWDKGLLLFADRNANRIRDETEPVLKVWQQEASGLNVHTSLSRKAIRFLPNGTSSGSNARITLCDERGLEHARAVVVANTGRIREERADRGTAIACK